MTIKKDIKKIMEYLEEEELELSDEIKQQIMESRKRLIRDDTSGRG